MAIAPPNALFDEITDFLLSAPAPQQIIAFKPSKELDDRLHELLEKNGQERLTQEERVELDTFLQVDHLLTILKAKARLKLAGQE
jgi:hypothetical protein